jgi:hypothetical protein
MILAILPILLIIIFVFAGVKRAFAGLLTLFVPVIGIFIGRAILGNFSSHAWLYFPGFWIPPLSLIAAIMMWAGALDKKKSDPAPEQTTTTTTTSSSTVENYGVPRLGYAPHLRIPHPPHGCCRVR